LNGPRPHLVFKREEEIQIFFIVAQPDGHILVLEISGRDCRPFTALTVDMNRLGNPKPLYFLRLKPVITAIINIAGITNLTPAKKDDFNFIKSNPLKTESFIL
jgi:hypothetical protein